MNTKETANPDLTPLKKVGAAIAVFYLIAMLFNAQGLLRNAERLAYGRQRQVCLALSKPLAEFANRLGVTKLRSTIECWMRDET